jgi:cell division septation protein DedD
VPRAAPAIVPIDTAPRGFVVSFAALLSEQRARDLAAQIKVRGQAARVVGTQREGTTIYRVLLGPFPTRDEAERVGRESGQTYWVYEGTP